MEFASVKRGGAGSSFFKGGGTNIITKETGRKRNDESKRGCVFFYFVLVFAIRFRIYSV